MSDDASLQPDPVCPQCGYSRAGLDAAQSCPECGAPPPRPFTGPPIDAADPIWVTDIRDGLRLVLVACAIGVVAGFFGLALSALSASQTPADAAFGLGLVVAVILGARGWWVATRPEPFTSTSGARHMVGLAVRLSAIGGAVAISAGAIAVQAASHFGDAGISQVMQRATLVAAGIAGVVHVPTALVFHLRIARLGGDARLAKSCRQGMWLMPLSHIAYGVTLLDPRAAPWVKGFATSPGSLVGSIMGLFVAILLLITALVTLVTPIAYAFLTWRAYRHARASIRRREAAARTDSPTTP